jgi:uncharacterized membrane protein YbaN (DUF454 family)
MLVFWLKNQIPSLFILISSCCRKNPEKFLLGSLFSESWFSQAISKFCFTVPCTQAVRGQVIIHCLVTLQLHCWLAMLFGWHRVFLSAYSIGYEPYLI